MFIQRKHTVFMFVFLLFLTFVMSFFTLTTNASHHFFEKQKLYSNQLTIGKVIKVNDQEIWIENFDSMKFSNLIKLTMDGGKNWKTVFSDPDMLIFGFNVIGNRVWVYGVDRGKKDSLLFKSSDHGITWKRLDIKSRGILERGDFISADTGWIFTQYGDLLPIHNAEPAPIIPATRVRKKVEIMGVQSDKKVWFATEVGSFFQSTDSGQTWLERTDILTKVKKFKRGGIIQPVSIKFTDNKYGFIAAKILVKAKQEDYGYYIGIILFSDDGGINWNIRKVPDTKGLGVLSIVSNKELWVVPTTSASSKELYHSIDGGISWSKVKLPDEFDHVTNLVFHDSKNGIMVNTNGVSDEMFLTRDSGKKWEKIY